MENTEDAVRAELTKSMTIRMTQEMADWINSKGGASWLRDTVQALRLNDRSVPRKNGVAAPRSVDEAREESSMWHSFVSVWRKRFGIRKVGVDELFTVAAGVADMQLAVLGAGGDKSQRIRLGKAIFQRVNRTFADCKVVDAGVDFKGRRQYTLARINAVKAPSSVGQKREEAEMWRSFIHGWFRLHSFQTVGVDELIIVAREEKDLMDMVAGSGSESSQRIRLGKALARRIEMTFGNYRIKQQPKDKSGRRQYRLVNVDIPAPL